jgi:hypothetical protein
MESRTVLSSLFLVSFSSKQNFRYFISCNSFSTASLDNFLEVIPYVLARSQMTSTKLFSSLNEGIFLLSGIVIPVLSLNSFGVGRAELFL